MFAVSLLAGPAALGSGPVDSAHRLAELRTERPDLAAEVELARTTVRAIEATFTASRIALDDALAHRTDALLELENLESRLRDARSSFDQGIQQLYIRGGSAAVAVVMFFDDPTEAGIATHYLEAVGESDVAALDEIAPLLDEISSVSHQAFDAVELAETDYATRERAYIVAAGRLAELEGRLDRLDRRIEELTVQWHDYRLGLASDILQSTGASGVLADDTRIQAELRADLPLGPTIGVPPGLEATGRTISGISSWYGPGFHGRRASSGAIFDERDFTVAHKTLPHGTLLLITHGDRQAVVMVNDRGPFIEGREFDLSKAAAEYLGVGLSPVEAAFLVPES